MAKQTFLVAMLTSFLIFGCSVKPLEIVELRYYAVDSMDGIISQTGVRIDREISSDGKGSLRVDTTQPTTVRLYEIGDLGVDNSRLIYQAKIRTEKIDGKVYLEMWCRFPGKGEFFSRALHAALSGTNNWTSQETPFILKKGEKPDNARLNLVVEGKGTVWIDDIHLIKGPLQ